MGLSQNAVSIRARSTDGETKVARLLAEGFQRNEIPFKLNLSVNTVKTHPGKVYRKLGVHNEAVAVPKFLLNPELTDSKDSE